MRFISAEERTRHRRSQTRWQVIIAVTMVGGIIAAFTIGFWNSPPGTLESFFFTGR